MILNIETSSKICSVAVSNKGENYFSLESEAEMDHATKLAPFVERCMQQLNLHQQKLDAVAVSMGPGSYTGLRIGLSLAKGLCFGLNIPLIGVPTLEIMVVKAMFGLKNSEGDELFIPMIDARRNEVYTAVYNSRLEILMPPKAMILNEDSFSEFSKNKLIMIGDGVPKAKALIKVPVCEWIESMPLASDMNLLSERDFKGGNFIDIAYSTPFYLKNFQATTPKKVLIY